MLGGFEVLRLPLQDVVQGLQGFFGPLAFQISGALHEESSFIRAFIRRRLSSDGVGFTGLGANRP